MQATAGWRIIKSEVLGRASFIDRLLQVLLVVEFMRGGAMGFEERSVEIQSRDYWFKVVEFLQQNWALIDDVENGCLVFFLGDTSGVFDRLTFESREQAEAALQRNGFARFEEDQKAQDLMIRPKPPFFERPHPNGPIYSSGRFWK